MSGDLNALFLSQIKSEVPDKLFKRLKNVADFGENQTFSGKKNKRTYEDLLNLDRELNARLAIQDEKFKQKLVDLLSEVPNNPAEPIKWHVLKKRGVLEGRIENSRIVHENRAQRENEFVKKFRWNKTINCGSPINAWAMDKTSKFFFTGGNDQNIRVWLLSNGSLQAWLKGHWGVINDMTISKCNKYLVSWDDQGYIWVWDMKSLKMASIIKHIHQFPSPRREVHNVVISERLITKNKTKSILIAAGSNSKILIFDFDSLVSGYSPNQITPWNDDKCWKWDLDLNEAFKHSKVKRGSKIATVAFLKTKNLLFGGTFHGGLVAFLLNWKDKRFKSVIFRFLHGWIHLLTNSFDDRFLFAGSSTNGGILYNIPIADKLDSLFDEFKNGNEYPEDKLSLFSEYEFKKFGDNQIISIESISWSNWFKYWIVWGRYKQKEVSQFNSYLQTQISTTNI
jgi:hypothetical protein